jgi:hypothetical protein
MDIQTFKTKHRDLINKGVITFTNIHPYFDECVTRLTEPYTNEEIQSAKQALSADFIVIDRFVDDIIVAEAHELNSPRADVLKMGYIKDIGIGIYKKSII